MRVLLINSVCGIRSTGRICSDLATTLKERGHECEIAYGRESAPEQFADISFKMTDERAVKWDGLVTRLFDNAGFNSKKQTERFIEHIKKFSPDIIHLHNIHGYYINIEVLFKFLKEYGRPVVWTLHDCWAFTGHCAHFTVAGCSRWKTGCYGCVQKKKYPSSLILDRSKANYKKKKELFTAIDKSKMVIVTPSEWLAGLVRESFLGKYEVRAIPNGVDLDAFVPTESNFRKKYLLENKKIILGAATSWSQSKGLSVFGKLAKLVPQDEYRVVLIGLTQQQADELPNEVLKLPRTNSLTELAEAYTAADVFVNISRQETMGLTTVEAMACGTPALTSNLTAVPEVVRSEGGLVIDDISPEGVFEGIKEVLSRQYPNTRDNAKLYEKHQQYDKYAKLYEKIYSESKI